MALLFEVTDCLDRRVVCEEEIWYGKILIARPFMNGWQGIVSEAVQRPDFICQDVHHEDRQVYFMLKKTENKRYIKVIVAFDKNKFGRVISDFPANSGKVGEVVIWPAFNK